MSDYYDEDEEMSDTEYDQQSCNICGRLEIAFTISLKGVPWAFNVCSDVACAMTAETKLRAQLDDMNQEENN